MYGDGWADEPSYEELLEIYGMKGGGKMRYSKDVRNKLEFFCLGFFQYNNITPTGSLNLKPSRLKELYIDKRMLIYQIARKYNISPTTTRRYLNRWGIGKDDGKTAEILRVCTDGRRR